MRKTITAAILAATLASGCASGPTFNEAKSSFVATPQGQGRIFFYRTTVAGAAVQPSIYLNGDVVGSAVPGGFFYVDRPAGKFEVSASTETENKLSFVVDPGQTRYVRLDMSIGLFVGHVVPRLVDDEQGAKEIQETKYVVEAPKK
jgi:hypothetical protein